MTCGLNTWIYLRNVLSTVSVYKPLRNVSKYKLDCTVSRAVGIATKAEELKFESQYLNGYRGLYPG
jgi:hypothetical protein